jgi:hypothetical protein
MRTFALSLGLSISFFIGSVIAIRRQRLREQTALLWLVVSFVTVAMSATLPLHLLDRLSLWLGISYGPALVFLLAVLFLMVLVFHLSTRLDKVKADQTALVQQLALITTPPPPADKAL